ncbi:MAG: type II toxin-antitoxin system VapC family toxin [Polyangiales bacterium]
MIVLDTHAWIFLADDPKRLGKFARRAIANADRIGIAAVSLWEFALLVEKKRLAIDRELLPWMQGALADPRMELLPLTPSVVATSHQLRGALDGDPGDRIIAATALVEGAKLVTKDVRITESGVVPVVW